jgi:hypothetical protein
LRSLKLLSCTWACCGLNLTNEQVSYTYENIALLLLCPSILYFVCNFKIQVIIFVSHCIHRPWITWWEFITVWLWMRICLGRA